MLQGEIQLTRNKRYISLKLVFILIAAAITIALNLAVTIYHKIDCDNYFERQKSNSINKSGLGIPRIDYSHSDCYGVSEFFENLTIYNSIIAMTLFFIIYTFKTKHTEYIGVSLKKEFVAKLYTNISIVSISITLIFLLLNIFY
jgi:hypothetical protein